MRLQHPIFTKRLYRSLQGESSLMHPATFWPSCAVTQGSRIRMVLAIMVLAISNMLFGIFSTLGQPRVQTFRTGRGSCYSAGLGICQIKVLQKILQIIPIFRTGPCMITM